jgi:spore germination cell wall hydrolase CwlJ-like protein
MSTTRRIVAVAMAFMAVQSFDARAQEMTSGSLVLDDSGSRERALSCLATAIAYEAGHEPENGQRAVAEVILNRVRNPLFPKSICGVVFEGSTRKTGCQFSFTCDGSLRRKMSDAVMASATAVARAALDGAGVQQVAGATHYHADYVSPYWAPSLVRLSQIGRHIFYRMPGARDLGSYRGFSAGASEPNVAAMRAAPIPNAASAPDPMRSENSDALPKRFAPWGLNISGQ